MAWLRQTGVRSLEDLKPVGALAAFVRVKRAGFRPSLNLLYALEGAILDCHWQEDPRSAPHRAGAGRRSRQSRCCRRSPTATWPLYTAPASW
jgi:hypothetical protein